MALLMPSQPTTLSFWGVRGSTPTVDRATMRYGGNTPCLELTTSGGTRFILDCGTGLRQLSNGYTAQANGNGLGAHIFVTHYHWDHIQGLPFFNPLYSPQNRFHFYSFRSDFLGKDSLKRVLEAQMALPYFPIDLSAMSAQREFTELSGGDRLTIGDTVVTACWLNHPQGCLGFRFDTPDGSIVYATDNEPGRREFDATLLEFCAGADVLINDAQFRPQELANERKGWGHSSWQESICLAKQAGVQHLVLFHHDPDSTDKDLDENLRLAQCQFENVYMAAEGMVLTLDQRQVNIAFRIFRDLVRHGTHCPAVVSGCTPDGQSFAEEAVIRDVSIQGAFVQLQSVPQLQSSIHVAIPSLGGNGGGPLVLRGRVVRLDPAVSPDKVGVGILFTE
jgi:phosphoribosyl 1,2-cyclic phosphodiesterase